MGVAILKKGGAIIRPQMVGGTNFHIGKNLAGGFVFTINQESMVMSPAQTFDLAQRLLGALGMKLEAVEQQVAALPGEKLAG